MIGRKFSITLLSALAWLAVASSPVSAEWFADLFVGPAFTQSHDVVQKAGPQPLFAPAGFTVRLKDVDFKNSASFGGRLGHWFESAPYLGFALDVSHFRPDIDRQTVTDCVSGIAGLGCFPFSVPRVDLAVTGISFDALLRWPLLTSKEFPKGQLQPYLTIGPTIFVTRMKDSSNFSPPNQSDTDTSAGVKAGAGVAWQFHKNLAFFGEYRFTHFRPEFGIPSESIIGKIKTKTDIDTHGVVVGASFRFP